MAAYRYSAQYYAITLLMTALAVHYSSTASAQTSTDCCTFGTNFCPGCANVNNCGNCNPATQLCGASTAQFCNPLSVYVVKPAVRYAIEVEHPCFYKRYCVIPPGRGGACTLSSTTCCHSETLGISPEPGSLCPDET